MANDVLQEKLRLHAMVDLLGSDQVHALRGLIEVMLDPISRKLANAPMEDEEIGAAETQTVAASREWLKHNQPIPHEEVLAEFGLTSADWEMMGRTPLPSDYR